MRLRSHGLSSLSLRPFIHGVLPTVLILITAALAAGQSTGPIEDPAAVNPAVSKIEHARALAAVHQLQAAATELENVRASVNVVALRYVTALMLSVIYIVVSNYGRSHV